jgi:transcription termination factor Rho
MSVLDRTALEASPLADLHTLASELSLDGYRRLRKADLIDALLEHQGAGATSDTDAAVETDADAEENGAAPSSASRRRRGRRGGRRATGTRDGAEGEEEEEEVDEETPAQAPAPAPRSRRGGKRAAAPASTETATATEEPEPEGVIVEGTVELLANGSGFLRVSPPEPSDDDVYISAAQVKRCELVSGDVISGPRRAPHRSERFPSLVRIDTINSRPASELTERGRYEDLVATFPAQSFDLSGNTTLKAIAAVAPIGRGSRVTICGGSLAGKSHTLRLLADTLAAVEGLTVLVTLAGVRPEEIGEWGTASVTPAAAVSFAASGDAQDHAVELVVDQARRIAARGGDAVVLIDTLDGLHPLSARKALAAARNIVDGGSLTVIATATKPLGGETTVITLDRSLALAGTYPALDPLESASLRPVLLVGTRAANATVKARLKVQK